MNTAAWNEVVLVVILASIASFVIAAVHKDFFRRGYLHEFNRVFLFTALIGLLVTTYLYATHSVFKLHVSHLLLFFAGNMITIYSLHITVKKLHHKYCKGPKGNKLLVIADQENLESTCKNLLKSNMKDRAVGIIVLAARKRIHRNCAVFKELCPTGSIIDYIVQNPIDEVLLSIDETRYLSEEIQTLRNQIMMSGSVSACGYGRYAKTNRRCCTYQSLAANISCRLRIESIASFWCSASG